MNEWRKKSCDESKVDGDGGNNLISWFEEEMEVQKEEKIGQESEDFADEERGIFTVVLFVVG